MYNTTSNTGIKLFSEREDSKTWSSRVCNAIMKNGYITDNSINDGLKFAEFYFERTTEITLGPLEKDDLPFSLDLLMRLLKTKLFSKLKKVHLYGVFLLRENLSILLETLSHVEEIKLNNCRLHQISLILDDKIGPMKNLKVLDLSNNQIHEITIDPTTMPELEHLNLDSNGLRYISFMGYNASIKYLDLQENLFSKFPEEVLCLSELVYLDISNNTFERIPNTIYKLHNLQHLDISHNKIRELPDTIKELNELSELQVSDNLLSNLPVMGGLPKLKKLNVSNNRLLHLFSNTLTFKNSCIEELDVSGNGIVSITITTYYDNYLYKLKGFNLSRNNITATHFINNLKTLENIDLSHNKLSTCYFTITLDSLKVIDLSHNEMMVINDGIFNQYNLKYLDVSHNKISKIPDQINNLPYLKSLCLQYNKITDIPINIKFMQNLKHINLYENPINLNNPSNIEMNEYVSNLNSKAGNKNKNKKVEQNKSIQDIDKMQEEAFANTARDVEEILKLKIISDDTPTHYDRQNGGNSARPNTPIVPRKVNTTALLDSFNIQTSYQNRGFSVDSNVITLRTVLINTLRDFIVFNPQACSIDEMYFLISNCNVFSRDVKDLLLSQCDNGKIIDGWGKTFMDFLCHIFSFINHSSTDEQYLMYDNLNYNLGRYKKCTIEKHIECIILSLDGICENMIHSISDIENMIQIVMDVSNEAVDFHDYKCKNLKEKFEDEFYTEAQFSICQKYIY
jgi:Leucine-rich repeat (LRR) protein